MVSLLFLSLFNKIPHAAKSRRERETRGSLAEQKAAR
jgi:hypothetical protein